MSKPVCNGSHKGHLCVLAGDARFEEIKGLTGKPKFICFNCGRVANSQKNLCNPMSLAEKKQ